MVTWCQSFNGYMVSEFEWLHGVRVLMVTWCQSLVSIKSLEADDCFVSTIVYDPLTIIFTEEDSSRFS